MKPQATKMLTLALLVLGAAAVCYSAAWTPGVAAASGWTDQDPNQPVDPNAPVDPNLAPAPIPEMVFSAGVLSGLNVSPADVNEPNEPQPGPPEAR